MNDINTVTLTGRTVRDAAPKEIRTGISMLEFSVAVTRFRKDGDSWKGETHFFDAKQFYPKFGLKKGALIALQGVLQQDRWRDQEGKSRQKVVILARDLVLLTARKGEPPAPEATPEQVPGDAPDATPPNDEIPF